MNDFTRLEEACGGRINPETLGAIGDLIAAANAARVSPFDARVIDEYRRFMALARQMFTPRETEGQL